MHPIYAGWNILNLPPSPPSTRPRGRPFFKKRPAPCSTRNYPSSHSIKRARANASKGQGSSSNGVSVFSFGAFQQ